MELLTKPYQLAAIIIGAGVLLVAAAGLGFLGIREIHTMVAEAVQVARDERDAHWTGEIEKANAFVSSREADQAKAVIKLQAVASDSVRAAEKQLEDRVNQNAALPNGDACGLSGDRVQLLPD